MVVAGEEPGIVVVDVGGGETGAFFKSTSYIPCLSPHHLKETKKDGNKPDSVLV